MTKGKAFRTSFCSCEASRGCSYSISCPEFSVGIGYDWTLLMNMSVVKAALSKHLVARFVALDGKQQRNASRNTMQVARDGEQHGK